MIFVLHVHPCGHDPIRPFFQGKHIENTTKLSFAYPGLTHYKGWSPNSLRMMLEFCPLIYKICQTPLISKLPLPSPNLFPTATWKFLAPFLVGVQYIYMYIYILKIYIYIHKQPPPGIDCRTSRSFRRFFRSVENRRPVSEGSVPPRGSIADLWGPPWEKKTKDDAPFWQTSSPRDW